MNSPTSMRLLVGLILGWLVPGAGHFLYRRPAKGIYFGVLILLAFVVGMWLGDWRVVHSVKFGLYLIAQIWVGGPTLLALDLTKYHRITGDIPYLDVGLLFTAVAGLLNVVVLVDLYETHLRDRDAAKEQGTLS